MKKYLKRVAFCLMILLSLYGCKEKTKQNPVEEIVEQKTLHSVFINDFLVGAAVNDGHINGTDTLGLKLIANQFNTITPENVMKWMYVHPEKDRYFFDVADEYVALGEKYDMHIVGHTLIWHSQLADWMNGINDKAEMTEVIIDHIRTIGARYKGKIDTWDVVNEALNEDGTLRESLFYEVMGSDYIALAFKEAAKADPNAKLVYNDYNLWKPEKRAGVVRLVKKLQEKGIKIDGVGMQAHWSLEGPSIEDIENSILVYSELGLQVSFTELDVTALPNPWELDGAAVEQDYSRYEDDPIMNPYPNGLSDNAKMKLAKRYEAIFKLFLKYRDKIDRVTFWGVQDGQSWLNGWPINGRTNHPLLFDREFSPKKAYHSVIDLKEKK